MLFQGIHEFGQDLIYGMPVCHVEGEGAEGGCMCPLLHEAQKKIRTVLQI